MLSAGLGLGAAGCDSTTFVNHYGGAMTAGNGGSSGGSGSSGGGGTTARDMAVPDLAGDDAGNPDGGK